MPNKFKKTLVASALLTALISSAFAETPAITTWNSSNVPELGSVKYEFTGQDVKDLKPNYWSPLEIKANASGVLNDLNLDIQALGAVDGVSQDKQIVGIEVSGGAPEFGGDILNVTVKTNFVGGGNNQATAIDFYSTGTTTISSSDVVLSVASEASNGKAVYGIGLGGGRPV